MAVSESIFRGPVAPRLPSPGYLADGANDGPETACQWNTKWSAEPWPHGEMGVENQSWTWTKQATLGLAGDPTEVFGNLTAAIAPAKVDFQCVPSTMMAVEEDACRLTHFTLGDQDFNQDRNEQEYPTWGTDDGCKLVLPCQNLMPLMIPLALDDMSYDTMNDDDMICTSDMSMNIRIAMESRPTHQTLTVEGHSGQPSTSPSSSAESSASSRASAAGYVCKECPASFRRRCDLRSAKKNPHTPLMFAFRLGLTTLS